MGGRSGDQGLLSDAPNLAPTVAEDAASAGRVSLDGSLYSLVPADQDAPGAERGRLLTVRDSQGRIVREPATVYRVIYAHRVRSRLDRMDRGRMAADLRKNADLLRGMRRYHEAARAMDVTQKVLSDVLASGTVGTGAVSLASYGDTAIRQLAATIADLEMLRVASLFDETAAELDVYSEGEEDYRTITFVHASIADAAQRTLAIKSFAEATFPGYGRSWVGYTGEQLLSSFAGSALSAHAQSLRAEAVAEKARRVRAVVEGLALAYDAQSATLGALSMIEVVLGLVDSTMSYYRASEEHGEMLSAAMVWAEAQMATRATLATGPPPPPTPVKSSPFSWLLEVGRRWEYQATSTLETTFSDERENRESKVVYQVTKVVYQVTKVEPRGSFEAVEVSIRSSDRLQNGVLELAVGNRTVSFLVDSQSRPAFNGSKLGEIYLTRDTSKIVKNPPSSLLEGLNNVQLGKSIRVPAGRFVAICNEFWWQIAEGANAGGLKERCFTTNIGLISVAEEDHDGGIFTKRTLQLVKTTP